MSGLPAIADEVVVSVAGREVEGVVTDHRWTPAYNASQREATAIAVTVDETTTLIASPDQLTLLQ